jgi:hypothetical protein
MAEPRILGLTLIRPWGWCIAQGHKPVENRTWAPPDAAVGGFIAIHNGQKYDAEAARGIEAVHGLTLPDPFVEDLPGRIIAVARLARVSHEDDAAAHFGNPWFAGPVGWWLEDVTPIDPVPCKGAQGLWALPPDVLAQVRQHYRRARVVQVEDADLVPDAAPCVRVVGTHRQLGVEVRLGLATDGGRR